MKRIFKALYILAATLSVSGCSDTLFDSTQNPYGNGDLVTFTLGVDIENNGGGMGTVSRDDNTATAPTPGDGSSFQDEVAYYGYDSTTKKTRHDFKDDEDDLDGKDASIFILLFDENHLLTNVYKGEFVSQEQYTPGEGSTRSAHMHYNFKVTMNTTNELRYMHILVNHNDFLNKYKELPIATESDIFNSEYMIAKAKQRVYWRRFELTNGVSEDALKQLGNVKMVRNYARLRLLFNMPYTDSDIKESTDTYKVTDFEDVQWRIMVKPTLCYVAPYVNGQTFAKYLADDDVISTGSTDDSSSTTGGGTSSGGGATIGGGYNTTSDATTTSTRSRDGDDTGSDDSSSTTTTPTEGVYSYDHLYSEEGYRCHVPRNKSNISTYYAYATSGDAEGSDSDWSEWYQPLYSFENEGQSQSELWQRSTILIRAKKKGESGYWYYRLNFVDPDRNYDQLYIMRNISYDVIVDKINADGYTSAAEAFNRAAGNNISGATSTNTYNNVTANDAALRVEYTTKYILTPEAFTLNARYVPDISSKDTNGNYTSKNKYLKVTPRGNETTYYKDNGDANILSSDLLAIKEEAVIDTEDNSTNYRRITFTPNKALPNGLSITSYVRITVDDTEKPENSILYRDVKMVLRERYKMANMNVVVDKDSNNDGKENGDGDESNVFTLTVGIDNNTPQELFPLDFTFETDPLCAYPNPDKSIMRVSGTDASLFDATNTTAFHYHRAVSYDDWSTNTDKNGNVRFADDGTYKYITFFFKIIPENMPADGVVKFGVWENNFSTDADNERDANRSQPMFGTFKFTESSEGSGIYTTVTSVTTTTTN